MFITPFPTFIWLLYFLLFYHPHSVQLNSSRETSYLAIFLRTVDFWVLQCSSAVILHSQWKDWDTMFLSQGPCNPKTLWITWGFFRFGCWKYLFSFCLVKHTVTGDSWMLVLSSRSSMTHLYFGLGKYHISEFQERLNNWLTPYFLCSHFQS